jgi:hypothetical protein
MSPRREGKEKTLCNKCNERRKFIMQSRRLRRGRRTGGQRDIEKR